MSQGAKEAFKRAVMRSDNTRAIKLMLRPRDEAKRASIIRKVHFTVRFAYMPYSSHPRAQPISKYNTMCGQ
jgi:hypothetical protein